MNNVQETKANEEVTVLTDELGLQREYREVKRKAKVGEKVRIVNAACDQYEEGSVYVVRESVVGNEVRIDSNNGDTIFLWEYEYVVLEPTDIIRYNNERYRLESRKAEVGEKVVVVDAQCNVTYKNGDIRTVLRRWNNNLGFRSEEHGSNICDDEYRVLVPVKSAASALTANVNVKLCEDTTKIIDMLTSLSTKVTELEREVQTLKDDQPEVVNTEINFNTPVTTEEIAERVQKALEPLIGRPLAKAEDRPKQLTRADVVAKARENVVELLLDHPIEFVVNREKRIVVALLKPIWKHSRRILNRGIARCAPDDVFNEDIGKVIAVYRALGYEVPTMFTDAPKPEGVYVGDVVNGKYKRGVDFYSEDRRFTLTSYNAYKACFYYAEDGDDYIYANQIGQVIDDSDREEYRKGARC